MFLLTRGGSDAEFVLSAGGFHPQFRAPRGVPALARLGLDLSPASFLDMRCQAYLAVTSNTWCSSARASTSWPRSPAVGCADISASTCSSSSSPELIVQTPATGRVSELPGAAAGPEFATARTSV
jgi:hypothetical protein